MYLQDMKRTLSSFSSGVGTVVSSVGSLSAAVSTTVLNLAYADEDLEDFGDSQFASDLRGRLDEELSSVRRNKRREKELSVDSGVATDTMHGACSETDDLGPHALERVSSTSSSLSISSVDTAEDFIEGLNFQHRHEHESGSSGRDEITRVTDDDLISSDSEDNSEFSLGTVDITATEIYLSRRRKESAETPTLGRSLNQSGNLSDLRRSCTDISYNVTPRPLSMTPRSKSTLTLSPLSTEESTKKEMLNCFKTRSEMTLNTVKENEECLQTAVQLNNFVEMSHQDPTTIDSFDSSSGGVVKKSEFGDLMPPLDEDEDLLEAKDPFRESFMSSAGFYSLNKQNVAGEDCKPAPHNFNVGLGKSREILMESDADDVSVFETISEISIANKFCTVGPEIPVQKLKPLRKIHSFDRAEGTIKSIKKPLSNQASNKYSTTIKKFEKSSPSSSNITDSPKRKNYLTPPSQKTSTKKQPGPESLKGSVQKDSPRSSTQRSVSCTNLNSKTEDPFTRSCTLDGFNSLDRTKSFADVTYTPQYFTTESSPTADVADKSVTVQNSSFFSSNNPNELDAVNTNIHSSSEAIVSSAGTESCRKISHSSYTSSASTFYSFSSEGEQPETHNVILNGKTNKSFMTNMKNSFRKLTNFLSLSKRREKELTPIVPVPPPQHTKPEDKNVGKYRQCVRPSSPSMAQEFNQRSRSSGNLKVNNAVKQESHDNGDIDQEIKSVSPAPAPEVQTGSEDSKLESDIAQPAPSVSRKKPCPPTSLMSHISNHYSAPKTLSPTYSRGSLPRCYSPAAVYKSSPSALIPSPPAQRKPLWRETKASRLRLNRVKAPSMSSLNI